VPAWTVRQKYRIGWKLRSSRMCDEWGRDDHLRAEPWLGFWQQIEDLADEQLLELGVQVGLGLLDHD
jgi:hypothetical protein